MDLGADYCWQIDALGADLVTDTRCLTRLEVISSCISCCLPRQMSSEQRGEALIRTAGDRLRLPGMMRGRLLLKP